MRNRVRQLEELCNPQQATTERGSPTPLLTEKRTIILEEIRTVPYLDIVVTVRSQQRRNMERKNKPT